MTLTILPDSTETFSFLRMAREREKIRNKDVKDVAFSV